MTRRFRTGLAALCIGAAACSSSPTIDVVDVPSTPTAAPAVAESNPTPIPVTAEDIPQTVNGRSLVWYDDFDEFNNDNWEIQFGTYGSASNTLHCYLPENLDLRDGNLVLEARQQDTSCENGDQNYTSGMVWSREALDFTYGRVEVRMQVPEGQGYWPAAWLSPRDDLYGSWPASGEIDIVEILGHEPDRAVMSLHWAGDDGRRASGVTDAYIEPNVFHTYAIEWDETGIRWFIDDVQVHEVTQWRAPDGAEFPAPFDQPFFVKLNLAVGGDWPGSPDETTPFPGPMLIDWIRVYQ